MAIGSSTTFRFKRATGYEHPKERTRVDDFRSILAAMGRSEEEVLAQINAVAAPFGIRFGP